MNKYTCLKKIELFHEFSGPDSLSVTLAAGAAHGATSILSAISCRAALLRCARPL